MFSSEWGTQPSLKAKEQDCFTPDSVTPDSENSAVSHIPQVADGVNSTSPQELSDELPKPITIT